MQEKISEAIGLLLQNKQGMKDYLLLKLQEEDWHAVQDAASDIRDIESAIRTLNKINA